MKRRLDWFGNANSVSRELFVFDSPFAKSTSYKHRSYLELARLNSRGPHSHTNADDNRSLSIFLLSSSDRQLKSSTA